MHFIEYISFWDYFHDSNQFCGPYHTNFCFANEQVKRIQKIEFLDFFKAIGKEVGYV